MISDLVSVFPCYRSLKIYFWFISFPNLWKMIYVPNIYVYIFFSNHFCFKVYFLIISAFDFYLMMYLNVCPGIFRLCSILKIFLHIFLLLLNIFLLYFHGISSERTISIYMPTSLIHTAKQCCLQTDPGEPCTLWSGLDWALGLCYCPNTFWQHCMSVTHISWSYMGNLKFSIFAQSFSHQTLCQLKMYFDWRCEGPKLILFS